MRAGGRLVCREPPGSPKGQPDRFRSRFGFGCGQLVARSTTSLPLVHCRGLKLSHDLRRLQDQLRHECQQRHRRRQPSRVDGRWRRRYGVQEADRMQSRAAECQFLRTHRSEPLRSRCDEGVECRRSAIEPSSPYSVQEMDSIRRGAWRGLPALPGAHSTVGW